MTSVLAGRADVCERLDAAIKRWRNGKGEVLFLAGEPGLGKSAVLSWMDEEYKNAQTVVLRVDCRPPIGSFNVGAIAPLQPFGLAIEQLYLQSEDAARKRLALNVGMSLLSAIPVVGDFIYAVKAVSQDVNEYKRETAALQHKKRAAVDDCITSLVSIATRTPFVLLVDDGHWADAQSVEVVRRLIEEVTNVPLLLVWSYTPTVMQRTNINLATVLRTPLAMEHTIHLGPLGAGSVLDVARSIVPNAVLSPTAVDRLQERSAGVPGIIAEYISYLKHSGNVRADGTIVDAALDDLAIRASDHPATDIVLRDISEEDAMVVSLCAAEGREFTAFMLAALLNTDVISAIRLLRRVAHSTGLIKSLGMRSRYGIKTTVYEFTQTFGYTYFLHRPEYEERKAIHQRISEILSREHAAATSDDVRHQMAVVIAAHASEAEDAVTTARMLEESALAADEAGASDIADLIRREYIVVNAVTNGVTDTELQTSSGASAPSTDHVPLRLIASHIVDGDAAMALQIARRYIEPALNRSLHTQRERVMLASLAARACIELSQLDEAEQFIATAEQLASDNAELACTVMNVQSTLAIRRGDIAAARAILRTAAERSASLPIGTRILTLGNIVMAMRATSDSEAPRMERTLRKLTSQLGWTGIRTDLRL